MPLVNDFLTYDHPDRKIHLLRLNHSIGMLDKKRSLICPFQFQDNGLIVYDFPHQFEVEGRNSSHYIVFTKSGLKFSLDFSSVI